MTIRRIDRGKNHTYEIDGKPALGVTTALSKGLPKPALPYWSAKCVAEYVASLDTESFEILKRTGTQPMVNALKAIPWAARDTAAANGTEVHKHAQDLIADTEVDVPDHLRGYVVAAANFMDDWKVHPLLVERVVASYRWMYAGTLDLVAELPDGRRVLFDYKTSRSGIYPETALQLAAYRYADVFTNPGGLELPMSEVGITDVMAVWLRPDGYDVIPLKADEDTYKAFLHVAYVARVADTMREWVGQPVAAP